MAEKYGRQGSEPQVPVDAAPPATKYRQPPPMDPFLVDILQMGLICGVIAGLLLVFNYFDDPRGGKIDFVTGVGIVLTTSFVSSLMMFFKGTLRGRRFIDNGQSQRAKRNRKKPRRH